MDTTRLVEEVRKRQVIWDTGCADHSDTHKMATAWRQICKVCWPEFDTLPADQKRTKCLQLQKSWRNTKEAFIKDLQKQKEAKQINVTPPKPSQIHHDQLTFLIPVLTKTIDQKVAPGQRPGAKRRRTDTGERDEPVASSSTSGGGGSQESRERDVEEDRLFLLSLVSFMQDVPRTSKLALRADMIKLIERYSTEKLDSTSSTN